MDYQTPSRKHRTFVRSLSLRSFPNSHLFFSYLFVHLIIIIIIIIRYSQTQHSFFFFFSKSRASRSSLSLATTTVLAFSARFGCGFFFLISSFSLWRVIQLPQTENTKISFPLENTFGVEKKAECQRTRLFDCGSVSRKNCAKRSTAAREMRPTFTRRSFLFFRLRRGVDFLLYLNKNIFTFSSPFRGVGLSRTYTYTYIYNDRRLRNLSPLPNARMFFVVVSFVDERYRREKKRFSTVLKVFDFVETGGEKSPPL